MMSSWSCWRERLQISSFISCLLPSQQRSIIHSSEWHGWYTNHQVCKLKTSSCNHHMCSLVMNANFFVCTRRFLIYLCMLFELSYLHIFDGSWMMSSWFCWCWRCRFHCLYFLPQPSTRAVNGLTHQPSCILLSHPPASSLAILTRCLQPKKWVPALPCRWAITLLWYFRGRGFTGPICSQGKAREPSWSGEYCGSRVHWLMINNGVVTHFM